MATRRGEPQERFRVYILPAAFEYEYEDEDEDEDEEEPAELSPQPQAPSGLDGFFVEP